MGAPQRTVVDVAGFYRSVAELEQELARQQATLAHVAERLDFMARKVSASTALPPEACRWASHPA